MPRAVVPLSLLVWLVAPVQSGVAQNQPDPAETQRLYNEAIEQLKASQDRKNELAAENEKLKARIVELEKQLNDRAVDAAGFAERTWFLRSHYAAWERFLRDYPQLRERWRSFLTTDGLSEPNDLPRWTDPTTTRTG
jgi:predicted nuclease with TOPRIM domain